MQHLDSTTDPAESDAESSPDPESGSESAPEAPLNRAERRAQSRGKKPQVPDGNGPAPLNARRDQVVVPRRAGRRGNR